ncbi:hypothetical protein [Kineosporia sp. NBRC 101731]|uniref:hypothetical protein n=1 Tax=Kineosporia sp. NBRC 101731 TaxID=3032199 RepID=UPI0024A3C6C2|nr:hypothetical protein [Kineosporia sp. NBRC 101731]GLY30460.1 hypothetical protein Kisp02_38250 [Kineosporia sp. NBRC 101731]
MTGRLFPAGMCASHEDLEIELVAENVHQHTDLLESIRDQVVRLAALSRGWDSAEQLEHFHQVFKLESLFHADSLALLRQEGTLVGLAGVVRDRTPSGASILHVGSLALMPSVQRRGILPVLFGVLWDFLLETPEIHRNVRDGHAYLTAITQSPYIMSFLGAVCDMYPAPDSPAPDDEQREVARLVVERFDPEVEFDPDTFILREEAQFFYRETPYSSNRALNEYCDSRLRYSAGDTFALVGRMRAEPLDAFRDYCEKAYADLYATLRATASLTAPRAQDTTPREAAR